MTPSQMWLPGRTWTWLAVVMLMMASPLAAQQQEQSSTPAQSAPPATKTQDDKTAQGKKTQSDPKSKSKLEQETGTVNDRLFDAMPNFVVESKNALPPLTTGQKYRLASASVFDYFMYPFAGFLAAMDQANNSPQSWGQGWGAYGKRFGMEFADNGTGTFMTAAIYPSLLREDPRYYQQGTGAFHSRMFHSINRLFVTRTDSGHKRFNFSEILGNASAAGISNIYHAPEDRTASRNLRTFGMLMMWDGVSNEMKEFWPDIRRKVFRKKTP
ncbi:MAG TPA: hypothetical protein VGR72_04690 [Candidatus Acidoferrales bacterium]|nr:hypothetical protein [Candidatus Acidoferrales bacterium]